jgi:hypothetical protein
MADLVDDNKKPLISFRAQQPDNRQEVNESKIKFKYATKERQRKLNVGQSIDPEQSSFTINMSREELYKIIFPSAVIVNIFPSLDEHNNNIPANDPRYLTIKPISVTIQVSNRHPFPLSRFTNSDLQDYITNTFGKYILSEINPNKATHDEHFKGLQDVAFSHNVLLENNEMTGRDDLNKRAFNVYGARVYDWELNYINKKLEILGHKPIKKEQALFRTEKNINTIPYNIFELGEV